jgi:16S rRNA (cytosine967-C5)-methyltransferase
MVTFRRLGTIGNALRERLNKGQRDERLLHLLAIGAAQILLREVMPRRAIGENSRLSDIGLPFRW